MGDAPVENVNAGNAPAPRKKFTFTKRDPVAAAKIEAERKASIKNNPFGDAKPREAVIAERTGKDEKDVLAEAASEYQVKIRLTPEQFEEKKVKRGRIEDLKAKLEEEDADETALKADIEKEEAEMAEMLKGFEAVLIEKAKAGDLPRPVRKVDGEDGGGGRFGGRDARGGNYEDGGGGRFGGRDARGGNYEGGGGGGGGGNFGARDARRGYDDSQQQGGSMGFPGYQDRKGGGGGGFRKGGFSDGGAGGYQDAQGGDFGNFGGRGRGGGGGGGDGYEAAAGARYGGGGGGEGDYTPIGER